MIAVGLLRTYLGQLLRAKSRKIDLTEARGRSDLQRAKRLVGGGGGYLEPAKWEARRRYYAGESSVGAAADAKWAEQYKAEQEQSGDALDAMNPMAAMEGMKGQMAFMVQNMVMMQAIQYFFSGYVIIKVPFHLTLCFREVWTFRPSKRPTFPRYRGISWSCSAFEPSSGWSSAIRRPMCSSRP